MAITNRYLDKLINEKTPVNLVDIAGDSGIVVLLYRYKDHGRKRICYRDATDHEGVMEFSSVFSIMPANEAELRQKSEEL